MATENIVTGKYYRILKDKANDIWDRISFWTHADDVQVSSGVTLTSDLNTKNTKITATQTDFATIESSSVSAHTYIKGNLLVFNNQLYRAKTAIAVGNTLTVGTNIEAVNVGTLSNMLTASNGNGFYFDVKNGTYGFYPTASKTSSEFVPFGGTSDFTNLVLNAYGADSGNHSVNDKKGKLLVLVFLYSSALHNELIVTTTGMRKIDWKWNDGVLTLNNTYICTQVTAFEITDTTASYNIAYQHMAILIE